VIRSGGTLSLGFTKAGRAELQAIASAYAAVKDKGAAARGIARPAPSKGSKKGASSAKSGGGGGGGARDGAELRSRAAALLKTLAAIDSKKARATVPADEARIKKQIVAELGGHTQFDNFLREALSSTFRAFVATAAAAAAARALNKAKDAKAVDAAVGDLVTVSAFIGRDRELLIACRQGGEAQHALEGQHSMTFRQKAFKYSNACCNSASRWSGVRIRAMGRSMLCEGWARREHKR
jgi:hypothetical protein